MRWLVNYFRQVFCKHEFEKSEVEAEKLFDGQVVQSGMRVHLFCTKCGYHKNFWKHW